MEEMSTLSWDRSGAKRTLALDWGATGATRPQTAAQEHEPWRPPPSSKVAMAAEVTTPEMQQFFCLAGGILVDEAEGKRQAWDSEGIVDAFQGTVLRVMEFSSPLNSSSLLRGPLTFDKWLVQNRSILDGKRVLELKSGAEALAIFLRNALGLDVTISDSDDKENEYRIADNCRSNSLAMLPHIRHTWGDPFPVSKPEWEIIIASAIEPYADQSANLVKTLSFLLREYKPKGQSVGCTTITNKSGTQVPVRFPISLISWRRRVDPSVLFLGCKHEGLEVQHLGYLVYLIQKKN